MNKILFHIGRFLFPRRPHKHKWKWVRNDREGGRRYVCVTCGSEGAVHPYHKNDMLVLNWSHEAKKMPHEHAWCYMDAFGRPHDAPDNVPFTQIYKCECGQGAVQHYNSGKLLTEPIIKFDKNKILIK